MEIKPEMFKKILPISCSDYAVTLVVSSTHIQIVEEPYITLIRRHRSATVLQTAVNMD